MIESPASVGLRHASVGGGACKLPTFSEINHDREERGYWLGRINVPRELDGPDLLWENLVARARNASRRRLRL